MGRRAIPARPVITDHELQKRSIHDIVNAAKKPLFRASKWKRRGVVLSRAEKKRQILQDTVEAYHKTVSQWHERDDPGDTPCGYIIDENWRRRIGVSSDESGTH